MTFDNGSAGGLHTELSDPVAYSEKLDVVESHAGDDDSGSVETRCGYFGWRPSFLQIFNSPNVLVIFTTLYSMIMGGYTNISYDHCHFFPQCCGFTIKFIRI